MLTSTAQELIIIDDNQGYHDNLVPDMHEHSDHDHEHGHEPDHEVFMPLTGPINYHDIEGVQIQDNPVEIVVELSELPGAPDGTPDPEIEVEEEAKEDENDLKDSKKSKKDNKWDWSDHGLQGFVIWIKDRFDNVPPHSGFDSSGLERAISYLERLDSEISKAMKMDLDGELDANKIEEIRAQIEDGLSRLYDRHEKVKKTSKKKKKKADFEFEMIKEAQRINGVNGTFVTVPLLVSGIGRICINATVSAGHDLEKTYADQVKRWKLNDREQAEVRWFLFDMGYPMKGDRGFMPDEKFDPRSSDNFDYAANYHT